MYSCPILFFPPFSSGQYLLSPSLSLSRMPSSMQTLGPSLDILLPPVHPLPFQLLLRRLPLPPLLLPALMVHALRISVPLLFSLLRPSPYPPSSFGGLVLLAVLSLVSIALILGSEGSWLASAWWYGPPGVLHGATLKSGVPPCGMHPSPFTSISKSPSASTLASSFFGIFLPTLYPLPLPMGPPPNSHSIPV